MFKIISFLLAFLLFTVTGVVVADVADIPTIAGIGAVLIPAFVVQETGAIFFGASLKSLARPEGTSPGAGGSIKNILYAFDMDKVVSGLDRGADKVTITGPIVFEDGHYMQTIYATDKKIKPIKNKIDTDDNPDIEAWEVGLEFWHPGLEKPVLQFMAENSTRRLGFIFLDCATGTKYLLGQKCNSLHMKTAELQWEPKPSGGKGTQFSIMGEQTLPYGIYEGDLVLDPSAEASASASNA